jgi:predicted ATPase/DNA-binding SARP family transcriptional activator
MEFGLLNGLRVAADGVVLTPSRPKQRALLVSLLLHAGRDVSSDDLIDALWGERPPNTARTALYGHVSDLRRRLGRERLETRPNGYRLRLADEDSLDIWRFEQLVLDAEVEDPIARSAALARALALFGGAPLAEFRFEAFAADEAAGLDARRVTVLERWIDAELELGHHVAVIPRLETVITDHPHREGPRQQLMLSLYRSGRQADALRVAQQARTFLADELGVDPGPGLQRLEEQILNHDPHLLAAELPAPIAQAPRPVKPVGIVTFLVAIFEGATGAVDPAATADEAVHAQVELVRTIVQRVGFEVDAAGSTMRIAFARARDAAAAAPRVQRAARAAGERVRIGIHSADVIATDGGYVGPGHDTARHIARAAEPGQILLSQATRDLLQEAPLDEVNTRDLGEHRLTDLEPAQRLFQLVTPGLTTEFPPVIDLEDRHTNLPIQPSPLIGRAGEIDEVVQLLGRPGAQLVTLTGAGGTGKTRLSVHVAAELLGAFPDGVYVVDLAPLRDPNLVIPTIAHTVGVEESAGAPAEALGHHLRHRRVLLVLDNVEHLLAAGPAVAALIAGAPGLGVLATSRVPFHLDRERIYKVRPLALPRTGAGVDRVIVADSVALFRSRARAVRPGFSISPENADAVAGICRTLDGLPLAIELAAARIGILSPAALLARIGEHRDALGAETPDASDRHRTLNHAISWSYDLLQPDKQKLFRRLGVFSGGCSLEAAERICGGAVDVIAGLTALVDASLVRLEGTDREPRFAMLETIREQAAHRLEASPEADELRRRHADYFTQLAELAEPHMHGSPGDWPDRLEVDHDNLRIALDRLAAAGAHEQAIQLAGALWRFWYLKGHLTEGRRYLESALARDPRPTPHRGRALVGAAVMATNTGDFATTTLRANEGIELYEALGDAWGGAYCRFMLGCAAQFTGELTAAQALYETSIQAFRELGDEHHALIVSRNLASTYLEIGDHARGQALLEDNLRRARGTNNDRIEASTLGSLATLAADAGRIQDAGWMLKESLRIHRDLGDRLDTVVDLSRAAHNLAMAGKASVAVRLIASFEASGEEIGGRREGVDEVNARTLASARRQLDEPTYADAWRRGQAMTVAEAVVLALEAID